MKSSITHSQRAGLPPLFFNCNKLPCRFQRDILLEEHREAITKALIKY